MGKARKTDRLYTGAKGRTTLDKASALGSGYVVQPKYDGSYAVVTTDARGRFGSATFRSGKRMGGSLLPDFADLVWAPNAVIVCELEVWTPAANRCAALRGYRMAHVFDALRINGEGMASRPYSERYAALMRTESALMCDDLDKPWSIDRRRGRAHGADGRYTRMVPNGWRRMRVVPQMRACDADNAWADWCVRSRDPIEGLVVVAQGAPVNARGAKVKIKNTTTLDCRVRELSAKRMTLDWCGYTFVMGRGKHELSVGGVVEIACDGLYEGMMVPKFPRVVRVRRDLSS